MFVSFIFSNEYFCRFWKFLITFLILKSFWNISEKGRNVPERTLFFKKLVETKETVGKSLSPFHTYFCTTSKKILHFIFVFNFNDFQKFFFFLDKITFFKQTVCKLRTWSVNKRTLCTRHIDSCLFKQLLLPCDLELFEGRITGIHWIRFLYRSFYKIKIMYFDLYKGTL